MMAPFPSMIPLLKKQHLSGVGVSGREAQEGRDIRMDTADAHCCTAETNTTL